MLEYGISQVQNNVKKDGDNGEKTTGKRFANKCGEHVFNAIDTTFFFFGSRIQFLACAYDSIKFNSKRKLSDRMIGGIERWPHVKCMRPDELCCTQIKHNSMHGATIDHITIKRILMISWQMKRTLSMHSFDVLLTQ